MQIAKCVCACACVHVCVCMCVCPCVCVHVCVKSSHGFASHMLPCDLTNICTHTHRSISLVAFVIIICKRSRSPTHTRTHMRLAWQMPLCVCVCVWDLWPFCLEWTKTLNNLSVVILHDKDTHTHTQSDLHFTHVCICIIRKQEVRGHTHTRGADMLMCDVMSLLFISTLQLSQRPIIWKCDVSEVMRTLQSCRWREINKGRFHLILL